MTKETSVTRDPSLRDVVAALEKRGRQEEAGYYSTLYPFIIGAIYGLTEEETMDMSLNDLAELPDLPQKPLKYEGWNFWHGGAAFGNKH